MNIDASLSLFCAWLTSLVAAGPMAVRAEEVRHEEKIQYAGPARPELVLEAFTPPARHARGKALVCVVSGGFFSGPRLIDGMGGFMRGLAASSGYTVFAVAHASQGQALIGEMVPQVQRAIRFIRYNAARFGVDPGAIGIMGFSSGGFMALSAGTRGDDGLTTSTDPVERASSRVQAVVAFFPPTDFLNYGSQDNVNLGRDMLEAFARAFIDRRAGLTLEQQKTVARSISPRYYVSVRSAPTLLIHGDKDNLVPLQQSKVFLEAMRTAGAPCELRVRAGAGHGWMDMRSDLAAAGAWFGRYLDGKSSDGAHAPHVRTSSATH